MSAGTAQRFWRDARLPQVELREVADGRSVCYARHAHEEFSVGIVTGGRSSYLNERAREVIGAGTVVLMNPGDVHACNPERDAGWSYRMIFLDTAWMARQQAALGLGDGEGFVRFAQTSSHDPRLAGALERLCRALTEVTADTLPRETALLDFCATLHRCAALAAPREDGREAPPEAIRRAAEFVRVHCAAPLGLEAIAAAAGVSASQVIRLFRRHYGLTPHAYLLDCRVQLAQRRLRAGLPLAEVALEAGFADQAHFQRAFKRARAATPGQYRAVQPSSR